MRPPRSEKNQNMLIKQRKIKAPIKLKRTQLKTQNQNEETCGFLTLDSTNISTEILG